jgi:hypothetical protein
VGRECNRLSLRVRRVEVILLSVSAYLLRICTGSIALEILRNTALVGVGKLIGFSCVIFWVVLWRKVFNSRRFGTLCLFHLHRRVDAK